MVEIQSLFANLKTASTVASRAPTPLPKVESKASDEELRPADRAIHDTVDISGDGGKMVNLTRSRELANEIRSGSADENFAADLRKALEDVFRITRLFKEAIQTAFQTRV